MRFVKIGYTYFNPMRIECIKPYVYKIVEEYVPNVEVWIDGKAHFIERHDLDIDLPECTEIWEAQGAADAIVARVVDMVNEALN